MTSDTLHHWDCQIGTIARLAKRDWAIEPWAIVRDGTGVLFASADKEEAIAFGNNLAAAVCASLSERIA